MRSWGITLLVIGVGAFILPLIGVQFILVSIFGNAQYAVAGVLAVVGLIMTIAGADDGE